MVRIMKKNIEDKNKKAKTYFSDCENCVYFDYDELYGDNVCTLSLDEDDEVRFRTEKNRFCPYYRKYDEYKSVQKQN